MLFLYIYRLWLLNYFPIFVFYIIYYFMFIPSLLGKVIFISFFRLLADLPAIHILLSHFHILVRFQNYWDFCNNWKSLDEKARISKICSSYLVIDKSKNNKKNMKFSAYFVLMFGLFFCLIFLIKLFL